eukprot:50531-Eustigmatos_ZCMA.PRE.1
MNLKSAFDRGGVAPDDPYPELIDVSKLNWFGSEALREYEARIEVYLQSKYASYYSNGTTYNSDVYFYFASPIRRPPGYIMKLKVNNFTFPLSFYLVDSNTNTLTIGGSTYSLSSGNYSASSLMAHILTLLPG